MAQVPILAKADSMTSEELRDFRRHVHEELDHVSISCLTCRSPALHGVHVSEDMLLYTLRAICLRTDQNAT